MLIYYGMRHWKLIVLSSSSQAHLLYIRVSESEWSVASCISTLNGNMILRRSVVWVATVKMVKCPKQFLLVKQQKRANNMPVFWAFVASAAGESSGAESVQALYGKQTMPYHILNKAFLAHSISPNPRSHHKEAYSTVCVVAHLFSTIRTGHNSVVIARVQPLLCGSISMVMVRSGTQEWYPGVVGRTPGDTPPVRITLPKYSRLLINSPLSHFILIS